MEIEWKRIGVSVTVACNSEQVEIARTVKRIGAIMMEVRSKETSVAVQADLQLTFVPFPSPLFLKLNLRLPRRRVNQYPVPPYPPLPLSLDNKDLNVRRLPFFWWLFFSHFFELA
jgi:hypothetical protein